MSRLHGPGATNAQCRSRIGRYGDAMPGAYPTLLARSGRSLRSAGCPA
jgi:hypothetical protein